MKAKLVRIGDFYRSLCPVCNSSNGVKASHCRNCKAQFDTGRWEYAKTQN